MAAKAIFVVPKAVWGMVWIQVPPVPMGRETSRGVKFWSVESPLTELGRI